jgi:hypothetical protein
MAGSFSVLFSRPKIVSSMGLASCARLVWSLARPVLPVKDLMAPMAATPPRPILPACAVWTAMAFPMTGQRRAMVCRLDMLPPQGEAWRADVERARSVAGDVFFKKGHMAFDWRRTASMIAVSNCAVVLRGSWCILWVNW